MDNAGYVALSRQSGLMKRLDVIANNIANISTTGYRREDSAFAEHIKSLDFKDPSLSIATMNRHYIDLNQGAIKETGNRLDFAIEGEGFFLVETPQGERLTRAGAFTRNSEGEIVTPQGFRVLDSGGGAVAIPPTASDITVTQTGDVSADGQPVGRIGVVMADEASLTRDGETMFIAENGYTEVETPRVLQGGIEASNVNAVEEIAKLIQVQRTYEMGQKMVQNEDERIKQTVRQLGQPA